MKQLSIEEKAKCYDEAIEVARKYWDSPRTCIDINVLPKLFPELKESEDERIRKEIIATIHLYYGEPLENEAKEMIAWLEKQGVKPDGWNDKDEEIRQELIEMIKEDWPGRSDVIAWIEKQGKQKSLDDVAKEITKNKETAMSFLKSCGIMNANGELADEYKIEQGEQNPDDKVEPKFHEGDWVIYKNDVCQIVKREEGCNKLVTVFGIEKELVNERSLSTARLWTIQDAKDGDVLATLNHILIFETIISKDGGVSYCHYDFGCSTPQFDFYKDDNWYFGKESNVHPATKEQRDALMKAMADAGYTFDFEKKELKKIEQKPVVDVKIVIPKFRVGDIVKSKSQPMREPRKIISIGKDCYWCEDRGCIGFAWEDDCELVEQKPAWSEEDEKLTNRIEGWLDTLCDYLKDSSPECIEDVKDIVEQLKSLRPQKRWKPSDEQMKTLEFICILSLVMSIKKSYLDLWNN